MMRLANGTVIEGCTPSPSGLSGELLRCTYPDGSIYEGGVLNGRRHGEGTLTAFTQEGAVESVYTGCWAEGKREQQGRLTLFLPLATTTTVDDRLKHVYSGGFKDDARHGFGTMTYTSPDRRCVYRGGWAGGQKSGMGVMTWHGSNEGTVEEVVGQWECDRLNGHAVHSWYRCGGSPSEASSDVIDPQPAPTQRVLLARFVGSFTDGARHRYGEFHYASGARYYGGWARNLKHGAGLYVGADGRVGSGSWREDVLVPSLDLSPSNGTGAHTSSAAASTSAAGPGSPQKAGVTTGSERQQQQQQQQQLLLRRASFFRDATSVDSRAPFHMRLDDVFQLLDSDGASVSSESSSHQHGNSDGQQQRPSPAYLPELQSVNDALMRWHPKLLALYRQAVAAAAVESAAGSGDDAAVDGTASSSAQYNATGDCQSLEDVEALCRRRLGETHLAAAAASSGGSNAVGAGHLTLGQLHQLLTSAAHVTQYLGPQAVPLTSVDIDDALLAARTAEAAEVLQTCVRLQSIASKGAADSGEGACAGIAAQAVGSGLRRLHGWRSRAHDYSSPVLYHEFVSVLVRLAAVTGRSGALDGLADADPSARRGSDTGSQAMSIAAQSVTGGGGSVADGAAATATASRAGGEGGARSAPHGRSNSLTSIHSAGNVVPIMMTSGQPAPSSTVTKEGAAGLAHHTDRFIRAFLRNVKAPVVAAASSLTTAGEGSTAIKASTSGGLRGPIARAIAGSSSATTRRSLQRRGSVGNVDIASPASAAVDNVSGTGITRSKVAPDASAAAGAAPTSIADAGQRVLTAYAAPIGVPGGRSSTLSDVLNQPIPARFSSGVPAGFANSGTTIPSSLAIVLTAHAHIAASDAFSSALSRVLVEPADAGRLSDTKPQHQQQKAQDAEAGAQKRRLDDVVVYPLAFLVQQLAANGLLSQPLTGQDDPRLRSASLPSSSHAAAPDAITDSKGGTSSGADASAAITAAGSRTVPAVAAKPGGKKADPVAAAAAVAEEEAKRVAQQLTNAINSTLAPAYVSSSPLLARLRSSCKSRLQGAPLLDTARVAAVMASFVAPPPTQQPVADQTVLLQAPPVAGGASSPASSPMQPRSAVSYYGVQLTHSEALHLLRELDQDAVRLRAEAPAYVDGCNAASAELASEAHRAQVADDVGCWLSTAGAEALLPQLVTEHTEAVATTLTTAAQPPTPGRPDSGSSGAASAKRKSAHGSTAATAASSDSSPADPAAAVRARAHEVLVAAAVKECERIAGALLAVKGVL